MLFLARFPNGRPVPSSSAAASVPSHDQHPVISNRNEIRASFPVHHKPALSRGRQPSPTRNDEACSASAIASSRQRSFDASLRSPNHSKPSASASDSVHVAPAARARSSTPPRAVILPQNVFSAQTSTQSNLPAPSLAYRGWRPDQLPQHRPRVVPEHSRAADQPPFSHPQHNTPQPLPPPASPVAHPHSTYTSLNSLEILRRHSSDPLNVSRAALATPPRSRPWSSSSHSPQRPSPAVSPEVSTLSTSLPAAAKFAPCLLKNVGRQPISDPGPAAAAAVRVDPPTISPDARPPVPSLRQTYSTRQAAPSSQLNRVGRATAEELQASKLAAQSLSFNHQQIQQPFESKPSRPKQHGRQMHTASSPELPTTTASSQNQTTVTIPAGNRLPVAGTDRSSPDCPSPEDATIGPRRDIWLSVYQGTPDGTAYVFQSHKPITQWPTQHSIYSPPESARRRAPGRRSRGGRNTRIRSSAAAAAAAVNLTYADVELMATVVGGLRLSAADARSSDGQWSSFLVGVRGSIGKDESETSWPNKARHSHRIRYNIRGFDDVLRMLADTPTENEVEFHLMSLARSLDRSARYIWAKLVQAYGTRELADTGFSMLRVEQMMVQCQLEFQRSQAGSSVRHQSRDTALQFR